MPIDPFTGLELKEITPYPKFEGAQPVAMSQSVQSTAVPEIPTTQAIEASPVPMSVPAAGGLKPSSMLDKVLFTMFGTPDSMLTPQEKAGKEAGRHNASRDATRSANDPGGAEMEIPTAPGTSAGEALSPIFQGLVKLFTGGLG